MTTIVQLYEIYKHHPVVSTDSRQITEGCIFFALKGERFNGNEYAAKALDQGAAYVVIDEPQYQTDPRCLLVASALGALQDLANHHRHQFEIPVIGIGGSNGKTTTKELISTILSSHYPCHYTKGNLNNHIGVPLTLLSMPENTEVAVIEMGTNQAGDIDLLCQIANPTHGFITNIGKEHLEGFGDIEGVKKAEGELYKYLARTNGCAFINLTEKYLQTMGKTIKRKVAYTRSDALERTNDTIIEVQLLREMPFVKAAFMADDTKQITEVQTHLFGRHNFNNIMSAIALGIYFKVPSAKIKNALETYKPSNNRSQIVQRGTNTILLDAYNANPSSMKPALESLAAMEGGKRIAIVGDMLELGRDSIKEHEAILRLAAKLKLDQIVVVGKEFAQTSWKKHKAIYFEDTATAKRDWFDLQDFNDTLILIKGSRGIGLEKLLS
jgi:UDP-N-acetylmuramoyl-tripeptide--D-alanyl-D-alanine ligase